MAFWIGYSLCLALLGVGVTGAVLRWLQHRAILDAPNDRSNHDIPTPRGGGLAVCITVAIGWIVLALIQPVGLAGLHPAVIAAVGALALLSWIDDLKTLGAAVRFPAHLIACAVGVWVLSEQGPIFQGLLPEWLDAVAAILLWAGFLNFYNFMDGIDGITGVETLGIGLGLAVLAVLLPDSGLPVAAPLTMAAAALGFLVWNWPPAKLFLGDVGSVPLGYCLGWFLLLLAAHGYWAPALILPAYYLADAGITLLRRAARLEKVWQAHREHFYQKAVADRMAGGADRTRAHRHVSAAILCTNAGLIALSVLSLTQTWVALGGAAVLVGGLLWWMRR
ncbi:hypothetical protein HH303_10230 [Rhodospirillaceae bacterium KN72]|uniref:Glycosyl transferase n=1 Tax=Pacificispira spongiicola TaxID=2729598 RepID=A0A7Y0E093_9PROT|nr:glycosyltransferase family 4 protein [Pacificispira spongiicola]NMM44854.1 hypothetical protein [Pacificispira spongiicola]